MSEAAHKHGIPVIVDAAAERLTIPNFYLAKGADMVAYSGGKCLRGPQCAGLLLGRKDLLQAAWINSAPHHAFGRSLKVGKEEIMGMLAAVEAWVTARSRRRMEAVGRLAGHDSRESLGRPDGEDRNACNREVRPITRPPCASVGTPQNSAPAATRWPTRCSKARRAS